MGGRGLAVRGLGVLEQWSRDGLAGSYIGTFSAPPKIWEVLECTLPSRHTFPSSHVLLTGTDLPLSSSSLHSTSACSSVSWTTSLVDRQLSLL